MNRRKHRRDTRPLLLAGLDRTMSAQQLDELAAHADIVRVPAGQTLARTGRIARQFLAVIDGEVDVHDQCGHRRTVGPGRQIGADELLHRRPHRATVTTRTECTVVAIFGPAFRSIAGAPPPPQRARRFAWRQHPHGKAALLANYFPPTIR
jgi:CRP-like cAMP-binding protein